MPTEGRRRGAELNRWRCVLQDRTPPLRCAQHLPYFIGEASRAAKASIQRSKKLQQRPIHRLGLLLLHEVAGIRHDHDIAQIRDVAPHDVERIGADQLQHRILLAGDEQRRLPHLRIGIRRAELPVAIGRASCRERVCLLV